MHRGRTASSSWALLLAFALALVLSSCSAGDRPDDQTSAPVGTGSVAPEGRPVAHPAAEALVAFATGSGEPPAWADTVRFYYGERLVRRLDRVRAGERSRWGVCPRGTDFECPISPLDSVQVLLEDDGGALIELDQVPAVVGCDKGRVPDLADGVELVVLRPEVGRQSCFEDFVVGLGVDADDRVESVIYLRSGP